MEEVKDNNSNKKWYVIFVSYRSQIIGAKDLEETRRIAEDSRLLHEEVFTIDKIKEV